MKKTDIKQIPEDEVMDAIRGIRYGSVEIIIHDSRVVQIEKREKLRIITK
jgi:hypothetical protein